MTSKNRKSDVDFFMLPSTSKAKAAGLTSTQLNNKLQREINSIVAKAKKNYEKLETDAQLGRNIAKSNIEQLEIFEHSLSQAKKKVIEKMKQNIETAEKKNKPSQLLFKKLIPDVNNKNKNNTTRGPLLPNVTNNTTRGPLLPYVTNYTRRELLLPYVTVGNNMRPEKPSNNYFSNSSSNGWEPEKQSNSKNSSSKFRWKKYLVPETSASKNKKIQTLLARYNPERKKALNGAKSVVSRIINSVSERF